MTLALSLKTIKYLLKQQDKLDDNIKRVKNLSDDEWTQDLHINHQLAFSVEVHEFINECYDLWKYWKSKPIKPENIIDEAVDVIHFSMLLFNKNGESAEVLESDLKYLGRGNPNVKKALQTMSQNPRIIIVLASLLSILDHYGFTEQDIIDQYNRKNAINFERLEQGY